MEDTLVHAIYDSVLAAPEYARVVDVFGSIQGFDHLMDSVVPSLVRTLVEHTADCKHILTLNDEDFRQKRSAAFASNARWKSRGRDRKGQLFRIGLRDSLLVGWSAEIHAWVPVIPGSLQCILHEWLKAFYTHCNSSTQLAYAKYEKSLERDYAMTAGQRASNRGLAEIDHRRFVEGRRNKFVKAPKRL